MTYCKCCNSQLESADPLQCENCGALDASDVCGEDEHEQRVRDLEYERRDIDAEYHNHND